MKKIEDLGIIAGAVLTKYGKLQLIYHVDTGGDGVFLYKSQPHPTIYDPLHPRWAVVVADCSTDTRESIYLYASAEQLGFAFDEYGGLYPATVFIHHEKEETLAQKILSLANRFRDIKLPDHLKQRKIDFDYEPLDEWAREFKSEFLEFLPMAKPENAEEVITT